MTIFISHIHEEGPIARTLKDEIITSFGEQFNIFLAEDIPLGVNWFTEIKTALSNSAFILVIFSPYSKDRPWINIEAGYGIMNNNIVIPICCQGLKPSKLPIVYALNQGVEISEIKDIKRLLERIAAATPAKKFLGDINIASSRLFNSIKDIQFTNLNPKAQTEKSVVWLLGSHRVDNNYLREKIIEVTSVISSACVEQGFRLVMGSSSILSYAGKNASELLSDLDEKEEPMIKRIATTSAMANANDPSPNPIMLLGSLRSKQGIINIFKDSIDKIPDIAIIIGGEINGRTREEYDRAVEAKIPVLCIEFTGGVANEVSSTLDKDLINDVKEIQSLSNRMVEFKEKLVLIINKQTLISRIQLNIST